MKNSLIALFCAVLLAFSSCSSSHETEAQLKTTDSLIAVVNATEKVFESINPTEVGAMIEMVAKDLDTVRAICAAKKLELEAEDAIFYGKYKGLASAVKKFGPRYSGLNQELILSKKQLATLKSDLDNKLIESEKAAIYLAQEATAVGAMVTAVDALQGGAVYLKENLKAFKPEYNEKLKKLSSAKKK